MHRRLLLMALVVPLCQGCQSPGPRGTNNTHDHPAPAVTPTNERVDPEAIQSITRIEPGTDISVVHSDTFNLRSVRLHGDVLEIQVSYVGGTAEHDFELYWAGLSTRSDPPQFPMMLKHNKNNESGRVAVEDSIYFDVSTLPRPFTINIATDHGGGTNITSE